MKKFVIIALLSLAMVGTAFAKKEQTPERVYDHTGRMVSISGMTPSNVDIHVSAGGVSADSYCQVDESSVNCSDSPAYAGALIRLENQTQFARSGNGASMVAGFPRIVVLDGKIAPHDDSFGVAMLRGHISEVCVDEKFAEYPFNCDPLHVIHNNAVGKPNGTKTPFQYRLAAGDTQGQMICLPFVLTDKKKGEIKHHGEACYQ